MGVDRPERDNGTKKLLSAFCVRSSITADQGKDRFRMKMTRQREHLSFCQGHKMQMGPAGEAVKF